MNMIKKVVTTLGGIFLPALLIAVLAPTASWATETTYVINQSIGGGSIFGTLVTDGTQGALHYIDIDSWSFGASEVSSVGTASGAHAGKENLMGVDLSVTGSLLQFNFSGTDGGEFTFPVSDGGYIIWAAPNCQVCASITDVAGGFVAAVDIDGDGVTDLLSLSGVQTIGTVAPTPEPPTSGLILIGVAVLGMMAMRTRMFKFRPNRLS